MKVCPLSIFCDTGTSKGFCAPLLVNTAAIPVKRSYSWLFVLVSVDILSFKSC